MTISNFSSLIQLSATISIAFVAIEYAKSFTRVLCENIFKFNEYTEFKFKKCFAKLPDQQTIENIDFKEIDKESANDLIEQQKRKRELLCKKLKSKQDGAKEMILRKCRIKSLSSMSLYVFMYDVLLLGISGFKGYQSFFIVFSFVLCACAILYMLAGWIRESLKVNNKILSCTIFQFSSFRHSLCCISIAIILSVACGFCFDFINNEVLITIWKVLFIISLTFSFVNYIVFGIIIKRKGEIIKKQIDIKVDKLYLECKMVYDDIMELLSVKNVKYKIRMLREMEENKTAS